MAAASAVAGDAANDTSVMITAPVRVPMSGTSENRNAMNASRIGAGAPMIDR